MRVFLPDANQQNCRVYRDDCKEELVFGDAA